MRKREKEREIIVAQDEAHSAGSSGGGGGTEGGGGGGGDGDGGADDRERWARRVPSGRPDGEPSALVVSSSSLRLSTYLPVYLSYCLSVLSYVLSSFVYVNPAVSPSRWRLT